MDYRVFVLQCSEEFKDIFVAELADLGFDVMQETDNGIEAFSENENFDESATDYLFEKYSQMGISGEWKTVENTNWNEEWEKNYDPVIVDDKCVIKADFHKLEGNWPHEIIINPRMSFGTGHHATTYLMVRASFDLNFQGKFVLDAGCGTGVLAILAEKLGAEKVTAYDVSQLCSDNTEDNLKANHCGRVTVYTGVITELPDEGKYDIIYANINKNVLLSEMAEYSSRMHEKSVLLLSGFFTTDISDLTKEAKLHGLECMNTYDKDGWACMKMVRNL